MSNTILSFWFEEIPPKAWWIKSDEFDAEIAARFGQLHEQAIAGELAHWRETALGRLAEIIVLDQFSRNIYRDKDQAFTADPQALALAQEAVRAQADRDLNAAQQSFMYMPFMHSESRVVHQQAVVLFNQKGLEDNYKFELRHKEIIDRFGRYPHRNVILGRRSTDAEIAFLKTPGSSF